MPCASQARSAPAHGHRVGRRLDGGVRRRTRSSRLRRRRHRRHRDPVRRTRARPSCRRRRARAQRCDRVRRRASSSRAHHWLGSPGALTALVPLMLVAALRRDRAARLRLGAGGVRTRGDVGVARGRAGHDRRGIHRSGRIGRAGGGTDRLARGSRAFVADARPGARDRAWSHARDRRRERRHSRVRSPSAVIAFVVVLFGAWKRLQAPLAIGATALLVLAIDTFGPAAARLPEWVPLAAIGVLLMWIGATFERRREDARRATDQLLRFG